LFIDAALARDEPHDALRHVGVEIVADDAPAHGRAAEAKRAARKATKSASVRVSATDPPTLPVTTSKQAISACDLEPDGS